MLGLKSARVGSIFDFFCALISFSSWSPRRTRATSATVATPTQAASRRRTVRLPLIPRPPPGDPPRRRPHLPPVQVADEHAPVRDGGPSTTTATSVPRASCPRIVRNHAPSRKIATGTVSITATSEVEVAEVVRDFGTRGKSLETVSAGTKRGFGRFTQADAMLEALHEMHDAFNYRASVVPQFTANYVGVSMRHINRPLVAVTGMTGVGKSALADRLSRRVRSLPP